MRIMQINVNISLMFITLVNGIIGDLVTYLSCVSFWGSLLLDVNEPLVFDTSMLVAFAIFANTMNNTITMIE